METGGGSLKISSASGPVKAETGGGTIELWGVPVANVETGAGAVIAKFISGADRGDSVLETSVGDITVYVMPNVNMTVHASIEAATGHRIRADRSGSRADQGDAAVSSHRRTEARAV